MDTLGLRSKHNKIGLRANKSLAPIQNIKISFIMNPKTELPYDEKKGNNLPQRNAIMLAVTKQF